MINIKNLDRSKIRIDLKSYKNYLIYYIGHVTFKDLEYVIIHSVNSLSYFLNSLSFTLLTLIINKKIGI